LRDFTRFCAERNIRIIDEKVLTDGAPVSRLPNLLGALAIYRFGSGSTG
jgi:hypothetical protein